MTVSLRFVGDAGLLLRGAMHLEHTSAQFERQGRHSRTFEFEPTVVGRFWVLPGWYLAIDGRTARNGTGVDIGYTCCTRSVPHV